MWFSAVLCLCLFFFNVRTQTLGGFCRTPSGESAKCISVYDCDPLIALLRISSRSTEQTQFLSNSKCGYSGGVPYVCCGSGFNKVVSTEDVPDTNYTPNPQMPSRSECGTQATNRIFNGEQTALDEFPWMAMIQYQRSDGRRRIACGGSLINHRYIVTAAHCITGEVLRKVGQPIVVRLGEYNTTSPSRDCFTQQGRQFCNLPEVNAGIEEIIPHPSYTGDTNRLHDIALVRLDRDVSYSDYIQPICLAEVNEVSGTGELLTVAGWGRTEKGRDSDVKLKLEVPVNDFSSCSNVFRPLRVQITQSQICAGGEHSKDSCTGDSGGPLMRKIPSDDSRWMLEGLVSFGYNFCGTANYPGVYTRISRYVPWIHKTVR